MHCSMGCIMMWWMCVYEGGVAILLCLFVMMSLFHVQMDEHEKALSLLAHKLKDYVQAEEYCHLYSQVG